MRKFLTALWNEFIYGGHILSFGAASIVASTALIVGREIDAGILLVVYFGTHAVYLGDRYRDASTDALTNQDRVGHLGRQKSSIPLLLYLYWVFLLLALLLTRDLPVILLGVLIFSSGFAYSPIFKPLTKKYAGFKNIFVPLLYSLVIFLFAVYSKLDANYWVAIALMMIFVYVRLFAAVAFYDVKDVIGDRTRGIKTLATIIPAGKFYMLLHLANLASAIPIVTGVAFGVMPGHSLVLLSLIPYFWYYVSRAHRASNLSYYSYIYCDGEYLLWFPLLLIARTIWN